MSEIVKKNNTITRKIEIWIDEADKEQRSEIRKKLWDWNQKCPRIANSIATHLYIQRNIQELAYFNEDFKESNPEIFQQGPKDPIEKAEYEVLKQKNDEGSLTDEEKVRFKKLGKGWSPANRTYKIVSKTYKGDLPSDIFANINIQITSVFQKESKEYFMNKRSVRSYKEGMPMPFSAKNMTRIILDEEKKNYKFTLFGMPFKTRFGRDASGNKIIFERTLGLDPEYKFCNSSIKIDGAKIFLLAVFQFQSTKHDLKEDNVMEAYLSVTIPIALRFKSKTFSIGDRKEFLHQRFAIQGALRRQQIAATFVNAGGTGRRKKVLKGIEPFHKYEKNYVNVKHHGYSNKVIDLCLQNKCSELVLKYVNEMHCPEDLTSREKAKWYEENQPVLRNWSYYGLTDKFKYKCKAVGINLIIEKKEAKAE